MIDKWRVPPKNSIISPWSEASLRNFFTKSFFVLCTRGVFEARGFVKEYVNFSKEIVVSELELNISTDAISYKS